MHDSGTALSIFLAMALIGLVSIGGLGALGRSLGKDKGSAGWGTVIGAAVGAAVAGVVITFTFYESSVSQTKLTLDVPTGFSPAWVVLLEDPTTSTDYEVASREGTVRAPANGVLRFRSLDALLSQSLEVELRNVSHSHSVMTGPSPSGLRARRMIVVAWSENGDDDPTLLPEPEFVSAVLTREAAP